MKKVLSIVCAAAMMCITVAASAQDKKAERNYGPYQTNGAASNWFVSLGGGVDWVADGILSGANFGKCTPTLDLSFGKWVTPTVGGRLGYQGFKNAANDEKFGNNYIHGDVLWNISNQFGGYKVDRIYNCIPYAHTGLYIGGANGKEFALGLGLLNNFRINDRLAIFADLRASALRGEQVYGAGGACILDVSAGLTVNLGKKLTFSNSEGAGDNGALAEALAALADAKDAAKAAQKEADAAKKEAADAKDDAAAAQKEADSANETAKALQDELEALKNKPQDIIEKVTNHIIAGPLTVYFELGKSTLSAMEKQHLTYYFDNLLKGEDAKDLKFVLTGSADKSTGTAEVNERLCIERVAYVFDVLVNTYGVDQNNITIKDNVYSDDQDHPEFSRAVIIEH